MSKRSTSYRDNPEAMDNNNNNDSRSSHYEDEPTTDGFPLSSHSDRFVDEPDSTTDRLTTSFDIEGPTAKQHRQGYSPSCLDKFCFINILLLAGIVALIIVSSSPSDNKTNGGDDPDYKLDIFAIADDNGVVVGVSDKDPDGSVEEKTGLDLYREELLEVSGDALYNVSSNQYAALQWITNNGPIKHASLAEVYILVLFYHATDGDHWTHQANFLNASVPLCEWHIPSAKGAYCQDASQPNHISKIELSNFNVTGTLPHELSFLRALGNLGLEGNRLHGTLPSELGTLPKISRFTVAHNGFTGTIPTEMGNMGNELNSPNAMYNLAYNNLRGTIPTELGNLYARFLFLGYNSLTGTIPSEIGFIKHLNVLSLAENQFTGTIPTQLGQIDKLGFLWLEENKLSGPVPSELGRLRTPDFKTFSLHSNELTGTLPTEIGRLHGLETVDLQNNLIVGNIDQIFCQPRYVGSTDVRYSVVFPKNIRVVADSCPHNTNVEVICDCCCCPEDKDCNE